MRHYKTKEEIGSGFQYNQKQHRELNYNSLLTVDKSELTTMRTKYLIRDVWTNEQLDDLFMHLKEIIKERKE